MKQFGRLILLAALTGPGCMTLPPLWTGAKPEQPDGFAKVAPVETTPPPPVLPEQVSEANAKQMFKALREELDYAANEPPAAPKAEATIAKMKQ